MSTTINFYLAQADQCAHDAAATDLPNVAPYTCWKSLAEKKLAVFLLLAAPALALSGCSSKVSFSPANSQTSGELENISQNMSEGEGRELASPPTTPAEAGQTLRRASTEPPRSR